MRTGTTRKQGNLSRDNYLERRLDTMAKVTTNSLYQQSKALSRARRLCFSSYEDSCWFAVKVFCTCWYCAYCEDQRIECGKRNNRSWYCLDILDRWGKFCFHGFLAVGVYFILYSLPSLIAVLPCLLHSSPFCNVCRSFLHSEGPIT